jgi:predicted nucleic acid-binding protein
VRERITDEQLAAPELLDVEVVSAFRRLCAAGKLAAERAGAAMTDLDVLRVQSVPHRPLLARCWELRENVTVYDAVYIALAEILDVPLLTADRRLANAPGTRCAFELVV